MALQRYLSILFVTALTALFTSAALPAQVTQAQDSSAPTRLASAEQPSQGSELSRATRLGEHLGRLLEQPNLQQREDAMLLILEYARRYPEGTIDFGPIIPPLFDIYESDAPKELRLLALTALSETGEPYVMEGLARRVRDEAPGQVRRLTLHVLAQHME